MRQIKREKAHLRPKHQYISSQRNMKKYGMFQELLAVWCNCCGSCQRAVMNKGKAQGWRQNPGYEGLGEFSRRVESLLKSQGQLLDNLGGIVIPDLCFSNLVLKKTLIRIDLNIFSLGILDIAVIGANPKSESEWMAGCVIIVHLRS